MKNDDQDDSRLERAWDALEEGQVDKARSMAERELASDNGEPGDAFLLLAACEREAGHSDRALELLRQACQSDPNWSTPHLWMAEILSERPDAIDEALAQADLALDKADEDNEFLEAVTFKAGLELDGGNTDAARETLEQFPAESEADPALMLEAAHLYLGIGDLEEARNRFARVTNECPELADAWHGLGAAALALDDDVAARDAWLRTLRLDEAADTTGVFDESDVEVVAETALAELPARARELLENIPILIADRPARTDVAAGLDPRLLGLFQGTPLPESSTLGAAPVLTQIILFRKNLERVVDNAEDLRAEIRTTLLHETGHFFGMSEDDLAAVGLD